jgi:predicted nucleic acid-binding protein
MKAFLDTSVLVPVFYGDHVHHAASLDVFTRFEKADVCCGAHSLVEVYATLTRMPGKHRISGEQAMLFIADIRERLSIVALTADEYADMLVQFSAIGIAGGAIYDALLASSALKSKAKTLYTWNLKHYEQLGPDVSRILKTP